MSVILVPYRPLAVLRRTERGVPDPDKEDYELADASSRSALDKQEAKRDKTLCATGYSAPSTHTARPQSHSSRIKRRTQKKRRAARILRDKH